MSARLSPPFGEPELLQLRLAAENINDRHGITGLLIFDGQRFAQVIEGPQINLAIMINRIVNDPRHGQLKVSYNEPTDERQFADWTLRTHWKLPDTSDRIFFEGVGAAVAGCKDGDVADYFNRFAGAQHITVSACPALSRPTIPT